MFLLIDVGFTAGNWLLWQVKTHRAQLDYVKSSGIGLG